tara:strand:+ start:1117 stop:2004 length:888 start_codon:yes stop_codon:yes gene_type:complete
MTHRKLPLLLIAFASLLALPFSAAVAQNPPQQAQSGNDDNEVANTSDEIVVQGVKYKDRLAPVLVHGSPMLTNGHKRLANWSEMFIDCVKHYNVRVLHDAIDGPPEYSTTRFALGRLIQQHRGCYPNYRIPEHTAIELGTCNPANLDRGILPFMQCRAPYDRGAILRAVMAEYAADLTLTRAETQDPAVKARFNSREVERNKLRRDRDKLLFEISVCMTRLQPALATQLVAVHVERARQFALEDALFIGAHQCVGYAKRMDVPPDLFRAYISDAVYRWVVAARGVDSLIPDDDNG